MLLARVFGLSVNSTRRQAHAIPATCMNNIGSPVPCTTYATVLRQLGSVASREWLALRHHAPLRLELGILVVVFCQKIDLLESSPIPVRSERRSCVSLLCRSADSDICYERGRCAGSTSPA